jgi:hypothetical protein
MKILSDNVATGVGRIISATESSKFHEMDVPNGAYIIKDQIDTVRINKTPFSCVFLKGPFVEKSVASYQPGSVIFFSGIESQYHTNNGNLLIDCHSLPQFVNGPAPKDPSSSSSKTF